MKVLFVDPFEERIREFVKNWKDEEVDYAQNSEAAIALLKRSLHDQEEAFYDLIMFDGGPDVSKFIVENDWGFYETVILCHGVSDFGRKEKMKAFEGSKELEVIEQPWAWIRIVPDTVKKEIT